MNITHNDTSAYIRELSHSGNIAARDAALMRYAALLDRRATDEGDQHGWLVECARKTEHGALAPHWYTGAGSVWNNDNDRDYRNQYPRWTTESLNAAVFLRKEAAEQAAREIQLFTSGAPVIVTEHEWSKPRNVAPDGERVSVPREPTQAMLNAAAACEINCDQDGTVFLLEDEIRNIYKAMLDAAPTVNDASSAKGDAVAWTLADLRAANETRQAEWCPGVERPDLSFRAMELAGEVGEACNVAKKLVRERLNWRGSRATKEDFAAELADVIICADLAAMCEGVDLMAAVRDKFNATTAKVGLTTFLATHPAQQQRQPQGRREKA